MVRLADVSEVEREHLLGKACDPFDSRPWAEGPPLSQRRVALVTSAGLHRVDDRAFSMVDLSYRVIPGSIQADALTMTHSSVHFDRTGFREDLRFDVPLEEGDIPFVDNYQVMHARTEFEDYEEPERKRHLMRLWLHLHRGRPTSTTAAAS